MTELSIIEYFGAFITCWATGYTISLKVLAFKKLSETCAS